MAEPAELKALVHDHQSGAREIGQRLLEILQRQAAQSKAESPTSLVEELFDTAVKAIRSKPEMAVVFNLVDRVFAAIERREDAADDVGAIRMEALAVFSEEADAQQRRLEDAARRTADRIENGHVVVTHSRSSTVLRAFELARDDEKLFDVILLESRPLLEGRMLAEELARKQIPVRLLVDAAVRTAVEGADRVLVGSDAVTKEGVVNKVGTRALAVCARDADVPVDVVTETTKAWRRAADPQLGLKTARTRQPQEVWDRPPTGVDVVNLTFDLTPKTLVDALLHDEAAEPFDAFWDRVTASGYARRVDQVFSDELV